MLLFFLRHENNQENCGEYKAPEEKIKLKKKRRGASYILKLRKLLWPPQGAPLASTGTSWPPVPSFEDPTAPEELPPDVQEPIRCILPGGPPLHREAPPHLEGLSLNYLTSQPEVYDTICGSFHGGPPAPGRTFPAAHHLPAGGKGAHLRRIPCTLLGTWRKLTNTVVFVTT